MPIIRPISDLRNNFNKIAEICHSEAESKSASPRVSHKNLMRDLRETINGKKI